MGDLGELPYMGTNYLKVLGSGEIVKWRNFSEISQLYTVEAVDGSIYRIQSNRVSQLVRPEEAGEFELAREQTANAT
jgi:hypothetical protein